MAAEELERTAKVRQLRHYTSRRIQHLTAMLEYERALLRECDAELQATKEASGQTAQSAIGGGA
jgi:hypothetical protein